MTDEAPTSRIDDLEQQLYALERRNVALARFVDELNAVVIEQEKRLAKLERVWRDVARNNEPGGAAPANDPPPHY